MVAAVARRQLKQRSCSRIGRDDNWRHEFGARSGVDLKREPVPQAPEADRQR